MEHVKTICSCLEILFMFWSAARCC